MLIGTNETTTQPAVTVGSRVTIKDEYGEDAFRIVNHEVSDPGRRWISEDSPMGRALIGHRAGDSVRVQAPTGYRYVRLVGVEVVSEP